MAGPGRTFLRLHARLESSGKRLEEWHFDSPKRIRLGYLHESEIWLPLAGVHPSSPVFVRGKPDPFVRVADGMQGYAENETGRISFEELRRSGKFRRQADAFLLPLPAQTSVAFQFGAHTLRLFTSRPSKSEKDRPWGPKLRKLLHDVPVAYTIMLGASMALHVSALYFFKTHPHLAGLREKTPEQVFRAVSIDQLGKADAAMQERLRQAANLGIKVGQGKISRPVERIDSSGYIKAVTTTAKTASSGFAALFSSRDFTQSLDKALSKQSFGDLFKGQVDQLSKLPFGSLPAGRGAAGGGFADAGGAPSGLGGSVTVPQASVDFQASAPALPAANGAPEKPPTTGTGDRAGIEDVLANHAGQLQGCYEKALARDSKLSGKLSIQLTILATGKPADIRVTDTSIRDAQFTQCIVAKISGWSFPKPAGGSLPIRFPLIFSASAKG